MAEIALELSLPLEAVATSLGLGWNSEVIASDFNLTDNQFAKLLELETIAEMTVGEVLSLALALGHIKLVAGLLAFLIDVVVSYNLIALYT